MTPRADAGVHLVGSVPLADAETVFRTVAVSPPDSRRGDGRAAAVDLVPAHDAGNHPDMELDPTVPLLLGLIHHDDAKGDVARIEAARAFVKTFGVASECGWGRTDPERVPDLLLSHRAAAEFIRQGGVTS
jgi:hypothetical protein